MAFQGSEAEDELIAKLSQRARFGFKEAGYLVDENTGEVLDFCEAHDNTPFEVDFPVQKIKEAELRNKRVAYLHSHPLDSLPSETDWDNLVSFPIVSRYLTICETRLFVLERTKQTKNPHRMGALVVFLFEQRQLLTKSSVGHLPIKQALLAIPEDELFALLRAVNKKMAQTYAVQFQEVSL